MLNLAETQVKGTKVKNNGLSRSTIWAKKAPTER